MIAKPQCCCAKSPGHLTLLRQSRLLGATHPPPVDRILTSLNGWMSSCNSISPAGHSITQHGGLTR